MKKRIIRFFKLCTLTLLGLLTLVGAYLLSAFILSRISVDKEQTVSKDVSVYLLTNGVHTDLVVPLRSKVIDWTDDISLTHTSAKDTTMRYVAFGWGDKGFYLETPTWADLKFSVAFKAAFSLSTSAIHATFYKRLKEDGDCKKIEMSNDQYKRLVQYIQNSFSRDSNGKVINIVTNAVYGGNDAFYEAQGSYSLFHTCNTWANDGLKSCGQKASLWTPFDTGIFHHYKTNQ